MSRKRALFETPKLQGKELYANQRLILNFTMIQYPQVDEVFLRGTLTDDDGQFKCDDFVRLLKYGEGNND